MYRHRSVNICFMVVGIITIYMFFSSSCYGGEKPSTGKSISEGDLLSLVGNVPIAYPRIELGKEFYDRWTRPALPFPWELSMEEREKLSAREVMDRYFLGFLCYGQVSTGYYAETTNTYHIDSKGDVRSKFSRYWLKQYLKEPQEDILKKSLMIYDAPNDIKETAYLCFVYKDRDRQDDNWSYTPMSRKIRRLSISKQDVGMGVVTRGDDALPNWNMYTFRFLESEIFRSPGSHMFGWDKESVKRRVNGIGDDCWTIEIIPKEKNWYYKKALAWVSKKTFAAYLFKKYNEKGEWIMSYIPGITRGIECNQVYGAKDYHISWCQDWGEDHKTNCKSFATTREAYLDREFPEHFLSPEILTRPPGGLFR